MKFFISSLNVPIGYTTPKFPSLFWPLGSERQSYQESFLYYSSDMWIFTVYWTLILFGVFYFAAGLMAVVHNWLSNIKHGLPIDKVSLIGTIFTIPLFLITGIIRGFVSSAIVGLLLSAIYRAGTLTMSTWIPLTWGIAQILYDVSAAYSTSSVIL
ncbi:uncharacterized protein RJT21DRAFT_9891 [Scheffersomyces amazonensis]|uniref:uncharacterized protein n=1 Tax=Scheffersomyces amazonensis TaxID=1078765 RepID=UPI00315DB2F7